MDDSTPTDIWGPAPPMADSPLLLRPAGKTLPAGWLEPEAGDSTEEEEEDETPAESLLWGGKSPHPEEEVAAKTPGKRPMATMLEAENEQLREELQRLQQPKRKRPNFKAGSAQIRYCMRALQTMWDVHAKKEDRTRPDAPGHDARMMLMSFLNEAMYDLDAKAAEKDYKWREAPDRTHAKVLDFNVDQDY